AGGEWLKAIKQLGSDDGAFVAELGRNRHVKCREIIAVVVLLLRAGLSDELDGGALVLGNPADTAVKADGVVVVFQRLIPPAEDASLDLPLVRQRIAEPGAGLTERGGEGEDVAAGEERRGGWI